MNSERVTRIGLRTVALGYLAALLFVPVGVVIYRTFEPGSARSGPRSRHRRPSTPSG